MTKDLNNEKDDKTALMSGNFIHDIIEQDLAPGGRHYGLKIHTDVYKRQD